MIRQLVRGTLAGALFGLGFVLGAVAITAAAFGRLAAEG